MTLYEFNMLSQQAQESVIFEQSVFLHVHTIEGLKHALYAKDRFFIEAICCEQSLKVQQVNSFKSGHLLEKYSLAIRKASSY